MKPDLRKIIHTQMRLNALHRYNIHKAISGTGVFMGQPRMLELLAEKESFTQKEISDRLNVSPASVAVSVKRLQKAGLLTKTADENDLRLNHISISKKGREIGISIRHECDKIDAQMFKGFSDEEILLYESFINRLSENLSADNISDETLFCFSAKKEEE